MNQLLEKIRLLLPELPQSQQQVGIFVLENYNNIPFLTITNMAKKIGVSDTTIINFCIRLGFEGFLPFKKEVSKQVQLESASYRVLEKSFESFGKNNPFTKSLEYDQQNLYRTLTYPPNYENFQKLLNAFDSVETIHLLAFRTSAILAEYMAFALRQQARKVNCIVPGLGEFADKLCEVAPGDILIIFSFSRYSKEVVDAVRLLKRKKILCVLFTDSVTCPLYADADIVFLCETKSTHILASHVGTFSLLNAILTATAYDRKDQTTSYLKDLEDMFDAFNSFY